ncbi:DinB family protein [Tenacibaculum sp.]|uniref:DinB family protein n=1 Tax=Tenacibaculum sp. TaxID=1906242 RepID=UPI003D0DC52C
MKNIKGIVTFKLLFLTLFSFSQQKTISRDWTSLTQTVNINSENKKKFKIVGSIKTKPLDEMAWSGLWARVDTKDGEVGFFDNMNNRRVRSDEWKQYTIEGYINKNSKSLNFGMLCSYNGDFYFDDIKLFIEDEKGDFKEFKLVNSNFEEAVINNEIIGWNESTNNKKSVRVKEYSLESSNDSFSGKQSLLIKGKGIKVPDQKWGYIGKENAKNPEIESMISMLEDLKRRVERTVKNLPQEHVDHLHDPKANRIGALIMHLAAAEVYYQEYTFGEPLINKEKTEEWEAGMDLDSKGRDLLQGKPIDYYLKIYNNVREKTIEELRKRNDKWFKSVNAGKSISNQYAWFHVMEHQSSHLGQILFLKKRLPELKKEVKIKETIKN